MVNLQIEIENLPFPQQTESTSACIKADSW